MLTRIKFPLELHLVDYTLLKARSLTQLAATTLSLTSLRLSLSRSIGYLSKASLQRFRAASRLLLQHLAK